ncbi:MAG TPA: hypothetical protein PKE66_15690 [Pyrinomonadaceae bacterium]|nr:hypothetical protein [Pyrinomonadaceae bacterium]
MVRNLIIFAVLLSASLAVVAQKAEPKRISFERGKASATVTGTLSNDQEMDFVFGAKAGQTVKLKVTSQPKGNLFDFRIAGDGFELETDYDSYSECSFTAPATGDYLVFVRKRPTESVRRAKFFLRLEIN